MTKRCWETVSKKVTVTYFETAVRRIEDWHSNSSPWFTLLAIQQGYQLSFSRYERETHPCTLQFSILEDYVCM